MYFSGYRWNRQRKALLSKKIKLPHSSERLTPFSIMGDQLRASLNPSITLCCDIRRDRDGSPSDSCTWWVQLSEIWLARTFFFFGTFWYRTLLRLATNQSEKLRSILPTCSCSRESLWISQHNGIEGFKGGPQLGPHYAEKCECCVRRFWREVISVTGALLTVMRRCCDFLMPVNARNNSRN